MSRQLPLSDYPTIISLFFLCLLGLNGKVTSQVLTASLPSYAPVSVECPANRQLLRLAGNPARRNQTLSQAEANFLRGRKSVTAKLWREFFTDGPGKATGYRHTSLLAQNQQNWPVLGIAHSGGGLRASLYAAGVFQALSVSYHHFVIKNISSCSNFPLLPSSDTRSRSSPVRGVYPLASYVTGLSGGSWFVASLAANNYPTASEMVSGWQLENDLVLPGGLNPLRSAQFLDALSDTVKLKQKAGYNTSITDQWGRALGYHFLPGTNSES
jgi:lysophospholipase